MGLFRRKPAPAATPETDEPDAVEAEPDAPAAPQGRYRGRLVCDGNGNLLADEGDWKGSPVAWSHGDGNFQFVADGGESHNQMHHRAVKVMQGTTEESPHHHQAPPTDAHYAADGGRVDERTGQPTFVRVKWDPDEIAAKVTGHTDAYTGDLFGEAA